MAHEIKIPSVGESISEVQISEWLKAEGDLVKQDEPIAVLDSEKATLDLPAPHAGRLGKILHAAGETVAIGTVVAQLETEAATGANESAKAEKAEKAEPEKNRAADVNKEVSSAAENLQTEPKKKDQPAKEADIDASAPIEAKGKVAAETETNPSVDIVKPVAKKNSDGEEEVVPMTMLRRTVARRLVEAKQTMAMLTTFNEVDLSAVQGLRQEHQAAFEKRHGVKLGLMSFFIKAAIDALKQFPQLNAEVRENNIVYHNYFDIGVAIASERGLVVPVIRQAERLSFAELEQAIGDFARRAKDGKLKPDELAGGTFTLTNGGVFGSLFSTPIINAPQTGILGLHTIQDRPIALQGQVVIRPMMFLALTYDHRLVDGREAVLFLRRIKESIESPARMLIEI
jgi:2-oxoglutarate dehydrogenase E2 component (dihydrolipoamide succinyltransferase)